MIRPTRQGIRWFMVGVGVVILMLCLVSVTYLTITNHQQGQSNHQLLQEEAKVNAVHHQQTVTKDNQIVRLQKEYKAEQQQLIAAGKEQAAFAFWLVQAQEAICAQTGAACPPVPSFNGVTTKE